MVDEQEQINDELFGLWERGTHIGAIAMLNELLRLELITDPMADLITEAFNHDLIELKIDDDIQREAIREVQEKILRFAQDDTGRKEGRGCSITCLRCRTGPC